MAPDATTMALHREYQFRRAFAGTSHEEFMEQPTRITTWLLEIHGIYNDIERRMNERG